MTLHESELQTVGVIIESKLSTTESCWFQWQSFKGEPITPAETNGFFVYTSYTGNTCIAFRVMNGTCVYKLWLIALKRTQKKYGPFLGFTHVENCMYIWCNMCVLFLATGILSRTHIISGCIQLREDCILRCHSYKIMSTINKDPPMLSKSALKRQDRETQLRLKFLCTASWE